MVMRGNLEKLPLYTEQFLITCPAANIGIHPASSLFTITSPRDQGKKNTKSISILSAFWASTYIHMEEKELWHT